MMQYGTSAPPVTPAGDIGNHTLPKFIVILCGIIASLAISVRLFARYSIKQLGLPDVLLVISMGFFIVILYNGYQAAIYPGFGVRLSQFNPKLATASHFNYKLATIGFGLGIAFLKIAILLDWMQIFVPTGTRNTLFWIFQGLILGNGLFYFIGSFIDGFICPERGLGTAKCSSELVKYIVASSIVNLVSDITVLITPHWVIWKLNMSNAQKKGISLLFVIGLLATGSALARLICVVNAYHTHDMLYYTIIINILAISEQTFGFLVIGVPSIPKAFRGFDWAKSFGSRLSRKQPSNPLYYSEQGVTPPVSSPRKRRDPWDTDTRALVRSGECDYISLPDLALMPKGRRDCSGDESGTGA